MKKSEAELIKKHLPFKSHYITISGHQMHYIDEGKGPVVLLLHGNPTWCFYYRNLIQELKSQFRVIAPDFIGMGLSDHPKNTHFRAADRIEHLQEFIDSLKLERFAVVMHDWGGSIGSGIAVRNASKIDRLIYLNTTLTVTESLPKIIKTAASPLIGKFLTMHTRRFLKLTTEVGVSKKLDKEVKKCYLLPYKTRARRSAIWDFVDDIPFTSQHPSYSSMLELASRIPDLADVPVQIIWGLKDPCFHREMLNHVAALFPQARVLEIPEASHLVLEDSPELVSSTIKNFLLLSYADAMQPIFSESDRFDEHDGINALFAAFHLTAENSLYSFAAIRPSFLIDDVKYSQINYKDIKKLINKYQRGLVRLGLKSGDKVLMLVSPGIDFLALAYSVMGRGAIPVFLDPGMGRKKLIDCIEELQPDGMIASPKAFLLKLVKRDIFKNLKFQVAATEWFLGKGVSLSYLKKFADQALPPAPANGTVLIAYTSGGTGCPKGVIYNNEMIEEQLRIFREDFGLQSGKKDLPLLPIFSLFNLALGVTSVFPPLNPAKPLDLEPQKIVQIINDLGVDYSFGSPTLWRKIAEYCFRSRKNLISLKKIFMAGAPVPKRTIELLQETMVAGEIYTPYGATEALPITLITGDEILLTQPEVAAAGEQGTLVGKPVSAVELKIVQAMDSITDKFSELRELSNYQIGEVIVQGKNVSKAYLSEAATKKNKISDGEKTWHFVGDMGYRDSKGNLYFCGRKAHIVSNQQATYYSVPCEYIFNQHPKVYRTALVELSNSEPAIVVEPLPEHWPDSAGLKKNFVQELKELGSKHSYTQSIQRFFFHSNFPVDGRHNAKIFRDQLGIWASEQDKQTAKAA